METPKTESLPQPPGIIASIKAGFDTVAAHLSVVLFPLALNIFLWLGPRLRMDSLFNSVVDDMVDFWKSIGVSAQNIEQMVNLYSETAPTVNLFWFLRALPIGISSLVLPEGLGQTPLGDPSTFQVSAGGLFGWPILLTLIGWVFGGLYYRSVAKFALQDEAPIQASRAIWQTFFISIGWLVLVAFLGFPLFVILGLLLRINEFILNIALLALSLVSMWVIVPVFFWPHGVFLKRQNAITSIVSSIQLARFTLPTSSMFVLTFFLMTIGLNYVWTIPPQDSWMALVSILGHAFVSASLLAGSFIYYRDMSEWLQTALERFKLNRQTIK